jgi:hypothetical protein
LETPAYNSQWAYYSRLFINRIVKTVEDRHFPPQPFYVAKWGNEHPNWDAFMCSQPDFKGFYWNGGLEKPNVEPPENGGYTLWIPYTAGCDYPEYGWGLEDVFEYMNGCWFPNENICVQPNVYQTNRGFWDMLKIWRLARKYGMGLELEYDERLFDDPSYAKRFKYYKLFYRVTPHYFKAVYGGGKESILKLEEVLR